MIGKGGEKMAWRREKVGPQIRNPTYFADYTARQNSIPVQGESCYTWFCAAITLHFVYSSHPTFLT